MTAAHYERLAALVGADASASRITDYPGGVRVEPRAGMITVYRQPRS
jgi:hypothetical protein